MKTTFPYLIHLFSALASLAFLAPLGARPDAVAVITGKTPGAGFEYRNEHIRALPEEPAMEDLLALIDFLATPGDGTPETDRVDAPTPESSPLSPGELAGLRNDIASRLGRSRKVDAPLAEALLAAWNDPEQCPLWRDYSLQHLGNLPARLEPTLRNTVLDTLWEASRISDGAYAGTALHSLRRNIALLPDPGKFHAACLRIAANPRLDPGSRATALSHATELALPEAAPIAREILASARRDLGPRMAALHALGTLGDAGDLARIEPYLDNPLPPLRTAARAARENLMTQP